MDSSLNVTSPAELNAYEIFNSSSNLLIFDISMSDPSTASIYGVTEHSIEWSKIRQSNVHICILANYSGLTF